MHLRTPQELWCCCWLPSGQHTWESTQKGQERCGGDLRASECVFSAPTGCSMDGSRPQRAEWSTARRLGAPGLPRPGGANSPRFLFQFRNLLQWYAEEFRDPLVQDPPEWFKSFVFCELVFQLPFFPIAAYAFFKGSCRWIRTPAIIYSAHTMTTVIPILSTLLFEDFSSVGAGFQAQGPETLAERLVLVSVYAPYLLIPLILLLFMLRNPYYKSEEKRKKR